MLVLTRRVGESIVVGQDIRLTVISIERRRVRIGISAPKSVRVDREEVQKRRGQPERLTARQLAVI